MNPTPDLSICIVNWNGRDLLRPLLASIQASRGTLVLETIIVDNASADGSADLLATEFPSVVLIRNDRNLGFARGNNQAARRASGRLLLFLNNDTWFGPAPCKRWLPSSTPIANAPPSVPA